MVTALGAESGAKNRASRGGAHHPPTGTGRTVLALNALEAAPGALGAESARRIDAW
jgi:hypothetical protein